jgi:hypothetical protein
VNTPWSRIEHRTPSPSGTCAAWEGSNGSFRFTDKDGKGQEWLPQPHLSYPGTFEQWVAEALLKTYTGCQTERMEM